MKFIIIYSLVLYQRFISMHLKRSCLFSESCSHYVLRVTKEKGTLAGLKSFWQRLHQCRPGYQVLPSKDNSGFEVHLIDGTIIPESEVSPILIKPFYKTVKQYETRNNLNYNTDSNY